MLDLEIVKSIRNQESTSIQVPKAFIKSVVITHEEINCITGGEERHATRVIRIDFLFLDHISQSCSQVSWNIPKNFAITSRARGN